MPAQILRVRNLQKVFAVRAPGRWKKTGLLHAVNDVSFDLAEGEVLGIVGESGCGKSTLGRLVLRLIEPTAGSIAFAGRDLRALEREDLRQARTDMQMVFQDPTGSLNPSMTVGQSIEESLRFHGIGTPGERRQRAIAALHTVGLEADHFNRLPHQMSGGQNQRVGIARALILNPKLLVMDEPVSALDVSVQAQILKLFEDLRTKFNLSTLFISHDLSVVRRTCDRIVVLYMGRMMEVAPAGRLFAKPIHPYTQGLLRSRPVIDPARRGEGFHGLSGELPSPLDHPSGCPFVTRCPHAMEVCRQDVPVLKAVDEGHQVACHLNDNTLVA